MGRDIRELLAKTFAQWTMDRVPMLAAALSFYTLFSIAPLLIICISVAASLFGEKSARSQVFDEIASTIGPNAAEGLEKMVEGASQQSDGGAPAVIGGILLLVGASAVFAQLRSAMNAIWNVPPPPEDKKKPVGFLQKATGWIGERLANFGLVLAAGFLLVASLLASSFVAMAMDYLESVTPFQLMAMQVGDAVLSLIVVTVVFALMFVFLPQTKVPWKEAWLGAAVTSALFNLGKYGISFYIGQSAVTSTYGAAGSLVVVLLWVYYACQIFFFGAELTQVLADKTGERSVEKETRRDTDPALPRRSSTSNGK